MNLVKPRCGMVDMVQTVSIKNGNFVRRPRAVQEDLKDD